VPTLLCVVTDVIRLKAPILLCLVSLRRNRLRARQCRVQFAHAARHRNGDVCGVHLPAPFEIKGKIDQFDLKLVELLQYEAWANGMRVHR